MSKYLEYILYSIYKIGQSITKICLFKYIENFTTKKKKEYFQKKILILFIFLLKTQIVGTR